MICTIRKATAVIASAVALFATFSGNAVAQMAIPGKFDVSPIGAATYTIPIQVPPGVAGMEPKLALSYNSRAGNGVLGVGWSLTGLPTITRCHRTTPQDGVKGGVAYDANDRFCLGGQRLMALPGSTYGAEGSSYRTEIESFNKVTAFGTAGSGPQYFVVKTKDGQTMEFGNTKDSRVRVAGSDTARYWALNKVVDGVGNTYSIIYKLHPNLDNDTISTTEPISILYTSNATRGLPATNSIEFGYIGRPDVLSGYVGGYPFKTSVRLASITTKTNSSVVSTYSLTYGVGTGNRSIITSISLCAGDGLCAPITGLGIGGVTGSPTPGSSIWPVTQTESSAVGGRWKAVDVNGDGRTDLLHLTSGTGAYRVWLSKGDGTFNIRESTTTVDATDLSLGQWEILDIDGDGQTDFIHFTPSQTYAWKSNGDGTFTITPITLADDTAYNQGRWLSIDVDGDGLGDLVHLTVNPGEDMRVWKSNGDGSFTPSRFSGGGSTDFYRGQWQVADVNGDGLADLVEFELTSCNVSPVNININVWKSKGDGTFDRTSSLLQSTGCWGILRSPPSFNVKQLDVNNDGLADFLYLYTPPVIKDEFNNGNPYPGTAKVLISKGDGTFVVTDVPTPPDAPKIYGGSWDVVDFDGDGLDDVFHMWIESNSGSSAYLWHSNGDGTFTINQVPITCLPSGCTYFRPGDFGGTGAPGFVGLDASPAFKEGSSVKSVWFLSNQPRNIVTSVANGVGGTTSWRLNPLPAILGSSYFKDIPSDSNRWTLTAAMPVVTMAQTNSGWVPDSSQDSLDRSTYFTYGSARVERNGRGFLGFNWLQSSDSVTGLSTRQYFSQDFPFIGRVIRQGYGSGASLDGSGGSWNNLSLTNTIYGCTLLDGGGTCPVAPGNRYFVYPAEGSTRAWDLDGTALPGTAFVNRNPDLFGNIQESSSYILNPDGQPDVDYRKLVINTYYNDESNWMIGRLVKSVVSSSAPTVAASVIPGSGGLPPAATPSLPPQTTAALMAILQLLLSDD